MALALALAAGLHGALAVAVITDPEPLIVDATPGYGLTFEGVGAISGGGATSRLLYDYPEDVASDILDYMFKPNFGLSLQMLKVEMGGDTDATEGAEPSHMHVKGVMNFQRGYEWWLMREAKKRNPKIKLYALPWGWPGWLDPSATADKPAENAFADLEQTADYVAQWILGAKRVHDLDIDYVGQWNENDAPPEYAMILRRMLQAHNVSTIVLDRMTHYPGSGSIDTAAADAGMNKAALDSPNAPDPHSCDLAHWNATDRGWDDEEGSTFDGVLESSIEGGGFQESARCLARVVNRNYLNQCRTATIQWYLIDSFYDYFPWRNCGVAVANEPWSGHYKIRTPLWSLAHTTQFSEIGWKYLRHGSGVGKLRRGGSYVTRVSPDGVDWSMVIEKMRPENSSCTRGSNPHHLTFAELVTFKVQGALATKTQLYGWYSDFDHTNEAPTQDVFTRKFNITLSEYGTFSLTVGINQVITVTTVRRGAKGHHVAPPPAPFPTSYFDDFESSALNTPPRYWFDQMGAWEVHPGIESKGQVMRQVATVWPQCWGYSCSGPRTHFGPRPVTNSTISLEVKLEEYGLWSLNNLTIGTDGIWSYRDLTGTNASFDKLKWHYVELTVAPDYESAFVDGQLLFLKRAEKTFALSRRAISAPTHFGQAAVTMGLNRYIHASVDNFRIGPIAPAAGGRLQHAKHHHHQRHHARREHDKAKELY